MKLIRYFSLAVLAATVFVLFTACPTTKGNENDINQILVDGFRLQPDGSGGLIIIGYTGHGSAAVIPNQINESPITAIGERAFMGRNLTSVTIPDSVTFIGGRDLYKA